jgi:hypothetical protein
MRNRSLKHQSYIKIYFKILVQVFEKAFLNTILDTDSYISEIYVLVYRLVTLQPLKFLDVNDLH